MCCHFQSLQAIENEVNWTSHFSRSLAKLQLEQRVRHAIELGDIQGVKQALETLPEGAAQRADLLELAEAFDLTGLRRAFDRLQALAESREIL